MTVFLGALLGAPVGGAVFAAPAFRDLLNAATWDLQFALYLLRAQGGGTHYRMRPRPRPLRLLAHGTHEAPRQPHAATGERPADAVEAVA